MKNLNLGWELDSYKFSVMKPTVTRNFLSTAPTFLIDHGHTMEKHNKTQLIRLIF